MLFKSSSTTRPGSGRLRTGLFSSCAFSISVAIPSDIVLPNTQSSSASSSQCMSDRAIRYIESNQREPSVDAIQKIAAALGVTTDYFMDEATFQQELNDDLFYADVRKKYGSRGVAQAKKIKEQTTALFAGGELSEEDQAAFIKEMEALFLDAKADAKKFTPKKYLR